MTEARLKHSFARDVILLKLVGMNPVVVHGGGPQIDNALKKVGKQGTFVQGMRITDEETMELVEMVLVGKINPELVTAPELRAAATFYRSPEGTAIRQKLPQVIDGIMPLIQNELV